MNIGILIYDLNVGGAERCAAELSKYLTAQGHHVYVFTKNHSRKKYDFSGKIVYLSKDEPLPGRQNNLKRFIQLLRLAREMKMLKKKYRIQTAVSFMEDYNIPNVLSKTTERIVIRVGTILSARDDWDRQNLIYNPRFLKMIYNRADQVIVNSKDGKNELVHHYGVASNKLMIIPNTVETSLHSSDHGEWHCHGKVMVCVARMAEVKQQALLAEVFARVSSVRPDVTLLFVGNDKGHYAAEVKRILKKHGVCDKVIFTGQVQNVRFYLEHSDIYVSFAKVEGFSNALIEALSAGLPAICMDAPGATREILAPGTNRSRKPETEYAEYGILLPLVDENKATQTQIEWLANEMIKLLQDETLSTKYRVHAQEYARGYSMKTVGKLWEQAVKHP